MDKTMISGQKITRLSTIGSKFASGYVRAFDDKNQEYRIHVGTLIQMFNDFNFKIKQERVYPHLEEPELLECIT